METALQATHGFHPYHPCVVLLVLRDITRHRITLLERVVDLRVSIPSASIYTKLHLHFLKPSCALLSNWLQFQVNDNST